MKNSGSYSGSGSGKIQLWVKVVAIPALLILAFVLGVLVLGPWLKSRGGGSSDITQNDIPASPRPAESAPKTEAPKVDVEITETPTKTPDETSGEQDGVRRDDNGLTITMEPNTQPEKPSVQPSDSGETPAPTNNPEPKKPAPAETVAPVEKSRASVSSPAGHGTYRVQAGTFANKTSADNLAADLSERGYRAEVKTVLLEDRTLYRVQVGEYKSRTSADQVVDKLKGEGYSPTVSRAD